MDKLEEVEIGHCLHDLFNEKQEVRVNAINHLGEIGDELCLQELREQLKCVNNEHNALIIAIGKLKQKFGCK